MLVLELQELPQRQLGALVGNNNPDLGIQEEEIELRAVIAAKYPNNKSSQSQANAPEFVKAILQLSDDLNTLNTFFCPRYSTMAVYLGLAGVCSLLQVWGCFKIRIWGHV